MTSVRSDTPGPDEDHLIEVVGAVYSGVAAVMTTMAVLRGVLHLERYITERHLDTMPDTDADADTASDTGTGTDP